MPTATSIRLSFRNGFDGDEGRWHLAIILADGAALVHDCTLGVALSYVNRFYPTTTIEWT